MKVEFISPFVQGATAVFKMLLNVDPSRGNLSARPQLFTSQQVNVVCGVAGSVSGQVIYGMPAATADKVAGIMIGQPVVTFDALAASAIAELGNMISGNSMMAMASAGYECDITPPTIIRGTKVSISTSAHPALVIPFMLGDLGEFEVTVSLLEKATQKAA